MRPRSRTQICGVRPPPTRPEGGSTIFPEESNDEEEGLQGRSLTTMDIGEEEAGAGCGTKRWARQPHRREGRSARREAVTSS